MRFLRAILLGIYGAYAGIAVLFILLSIRFFDKDRVILSSYTLINSVALASLSWMTFRSLRDRNAGEFRLALGLFVWGFGVTTVYRAIFVLGAPNMTELSNFLIFGIPTLFVYIYASFQSRNRESAPA